MPPGYPCSDFFSRDWEDPEVKIPSGKHHRQSKKELEPTSRLCRKTRKQVFRKRQSQHRSHCQDKQGKGKNQGYAETFFRFHQCFLVRIQGLFYGFLLQHPSWMKTCLPDCVFDQSRFNSIGIIQTFPCLRGRLTSAVSTPTKPFKAFSTELTHPAQCIPSISSFKAALGFSPSKLP